MEAVRLPWEWLADAAAGAMEAGRTDDLERKRAALDDLEAAKDACGQLGGLLVLLALERGGLRVQKRLAKVFDGLARSAWDRAKAAEERAGWAIAKVDALEQRVRELEALVESRDPGVREPGR